MRYLWCDYDVIVTLFKGQFNGGHIEDVPCQIPVNFAIGSWEPVGAGWRFAVSSEPTHSCVLICAAWRRSANLSLCDKRKSTGSFPLLSLEKSLPGNPERPCFQMRRVMCSLFPCLELLFFLDHKTVASSCASVHSTASPECLLCLSVGRGRWYGLRYRHSARGRQGRDPAAQAQLGDTMGDKTGTKWELSLVESLHFSWISGKPPFWWTGLPSPIF